MLDSHIHETTTVKLKFVRNNALLEVTNSSSKSIKLDPQKHLGIVDIRSIYWLLQNLI